MREKLFNIQQELKCNKGQYNSFGKYHYRSCEDILEAVKPLLNKYKCIITLSDDVGCVGERYYIKAEATITDLETGESIVNCAYAREEDTKKGMDGSQITGTSSSYARKYALNGLLLIDDTKDADTDEYAKQTSDKPKAKKPASKPVANNRQKLIEYCKANNIDMNEIATKYGLNGKSSDEDFLRVLNTLTEVA